MTRLVLQPITLRKARVFVARHHGDHRAPQGGLVAVAVGHRDEVRGVAIIDRPVSWLLDDGWTAEVTRLGPRGDRHVCSRLYAAAWRAARALGYRRLITYTLAAEPDTSLRAAGWRYVGETLGWSWSWPSRALVDTHSTERKRLWEAVACGARPADGGAR